MKLILENDYYTVTIEEKKSGEDIYALMDMFKQGAMGLGYMQSSVERGFEAMTEESITTTEEIG